MVTGGEALYADMGHFGKQPIRVAWFVLVLPALLLNYFGQGALMLAEPEAAANPFYLLAPEWLRLPLVGLATLAAIIASQALISGVFSITRQAVQLGYCPRVDIDHTSSHEIGQIYVPQVNWALMVSTIAIVVGFGTSTSLAAAYGIAVTLTMVVTAVLLHAVAIDRWKWPVPVVFGISTLFLTVDLTFLGANVLKIAQGGWLPLAIGALIFTLMTTWKTGRNVVAERLAAGSEPLDDFMARITADPPARVPGTAVFMTAQPRGTPAALVHNLRVNKVLHQNVVTLSVKTLPWPQVPIDERVSMRALGAGIHEVTLYYGFMEDADVPAALAFARLEGLPLDVDDTTYFLGRETLISELGAGDGALARVVVRADGQERRPRHRLLPAAARPGGGARRAGGAVEGLSIRSRAELQLRLRAALKSCPTTLSVAAGAWSSCAGGGTRPAPTTAPSPAPPGRGR